MRALSRRQRTMQTRFAARPQRMAEPIVRVLPAPVGGLNGRDALDDMDERDAIRLDNFFPGFGKVEVRRGSALHGTVGSGSFTPATLPVETLAEYHGATTRKLIAAADGNIYDITAGGDQGTALGTGFSNDRWQTANMNDLLLLVNGEDAPQEYDGTTLSAMTISGSGLTVTDLVGVHVFKAHAYYVEENSQDVWYSAVNAHAGTLTNFPLADVGSFGGKLMAITSWTRDGGAGPDDYAVFIMSSGEVIVYAGFDPGAADGWSLVGVFRIGAPLGRRCAIKIGGDVLVATVDGPVVLSKVIPGGRQAAGGRVSDKLGNLIPDQARLTGDSFGWQPFLYPLGQRAWLNFPTGGGFEQYTVNLLTGAWCRYRGMNASCWALYNDRPYFGSVAGAVVQADTGLQDQGVDVLADARQAFSYLGARGINKHVNLVSPLIEAGAAIPLRLGLAADFFTDPQTSIDATIGVAGGVQTPWGSPWGSPWSAQARAVAHWFPHVARGQAISPQVRVEQSDVAVAWSATRIAYARAGLI